MFGERGRFVWRVHARDASPSVAALIVECQTFAPDGTRLVYGRGSQPLVVIVRSAHGIIVTGLPLPVTPDEEPPSI